MSHPTPPTYDVFLSFRGEDTRHNFTSHLYKELNTKRIKTFIDDKLERGDEISQSLIKAIEESSIYVVILSKHYASSSWCLDELTKILQCKRSYGREVIPIFYEVDPSDVRHQRNSYQEDFVKHQQRSKDKIDVWKAALFQVAGLSGLHSQNIRPESSLVEKIAEDILKKMNSCVLSEYEGMIGIDEHIERIQPLLLLKSQSVRIIGIWGMGGTGKTTIASAIYHKLATQFSCRSIVLNVQQEIERAGLDHVRRKYLSELLDEDITSSKSNFSFDPRLKRTKILLVLDDVKDSDQLEDLIGTHHSNFGQGSRIIVTNRDKQVLKNANADEIYKVNEMGSQDSLKLFCSFAFKQNHPIEPYVSLSKKVLDYAKGVPIALKVLGKFLQGRKEKAWESHLQKLEKLPHDEIFSAFKLSYDGLDSEQKDIFLDIACFYRGELENRVVQTLDYCGFSTRIGIEILQDRCLISISNGRIRMHDLIQEMGHEIVRLQCEDDPGKRSRLWKADDVNNILSKNKGTDAIRCIFLNLCYIMKVQLHAETFKKMRNLRMLQLYDLSWSSNGTFHAFLESLPDALKFLCWENFPQRYLPQAFPGNLVALEMPSSDLEQLWVVDQVLPNLKRLNLRKSWNLIGVPDLSFFPNIEEIILSDCVSLVEIYSSSFLDNLNWLCLDGCTTLRSLVIRCNILQRPSGLVALHGCRNLEKLLISSRTGVVQSCNWPFYESGVRVFHDKQLLRSNDEGGYAILDHGLYSKSITELCWLDISNCESLRCMPAELLNLKLLRRLSFRGCLKLEELPEIKQTMENLTVLILDETAIKELLPSSLHHLVGLKELSLRSCTRLKTIPSSIGNLSKLIKLDLSDCESLETFPELKVTMENLEVLILDKTAIKELPSSFYNLTGLEELNLRSCTKLKIIPSSIGNLSKLIKLDLTNCESLETFPELEVTMENLEVLILDKTAIKELPSSFHHFVGLEELSLRNCTKLKTIPSSIGNLSKLIKLDLTNCESLETFPELEVTMENLEVLILDKTAIKQIPSSFHHLAGLEELSLRNCTKLETIPSSIGNLSKLIKLDLSCCESLETFPELEVTMENLEVLILDKTAIKQIPSSFYHLAGLEELSLRNCTKLKTIPSSIGNLSKLIKLDLTNCESLETFPELEVTMENLEVLILDKTAIKQIPSSFHHLAGLEELSLRNCTKLETIPSSIGNLSKLIKLDLSCCESLETFPELEVTMENLEVLILDKTAIKQIPSSFYHLAGLEELSLRNCTKLETIPSSIGNLSKLIKLDLSCCESLETFPELEVTMENLEVLILDKTAIKQIPSSFYHLAGLEELSLRNCTKLETIPSSIGNLSKLIKLDLSCCESLETFPELEVTMENLEVLILDKTAIKQIPSSFYHLAGLEELSLRNCTKLETIPSSIGNLSKLIKLDLSCCESLETFPELEVTMENLEVLILDKTAIKQIPSSFHHLAGLEELSLRSCSKLKTIPSCIGNLCSLSKLDVTNCESLQSSNFF